MAGTHSPGGATMEKDHLEILLEDIRSKFDLVLEGHAALDRKMDLRFAELEEKIDKNTFLIQALAKRVDEVEERLDAKIDAVEKRLDSKIAKVEKNLSAKIDAVAADLAAHRADTEAHHGVYRVKET